MQWRHTNLGTG